MKLTTTDPMEQIIEAALLAQGIAYTTDHGGSNPAGLDFYIPALDLHLEVKRFHSDRIAAQMARAPNVIAIQGQSAVLFMARLICSGGIAELAEAAWRYLTPCGATAQVV